MTPKIKIVVQFLALSDDDLSIFKVKKPVFLTFSKMFLSYFSTTNPYLRKKVKFDFFGYRGQSITTISSDYTRTLSCPCKDVKFWGVRGELEY